MRASREERAAEPARAISLPEWEAAIAAALPEYGYRFSAGPDGVAALHRMAEFLRRIVVAQARVRLMGSVEPAPLVRRHLGESLFLGAVLPLDRQRLVDLGTGAGFPGLALAVGWPDLNTTLVESNHKKAAFLQDVVTGLELKEHVQVWEGFIERRPHAGAEPLAWAELVTARAVEHMELLPAWLGRWLSPGTQVALWTMRTQAEAWRARYSQWQWQQFFPLPDSAERGIQLALWRGSRSGHRALAAFKGEAG